MHRYPLSIVGSDYKPRQIKQYTARSDIPIFLIITLLKSTENAASPESIPSVIPQSEVDQISNLENCVG